LLRGGSSVPLPECCTSGPVRSSGGESRSGPPSSRYPRAMPLRAISGSLHGPETVSWRVNQSAIVLLGGPRALLLQLAEPAVAAGVAEHSGFEADPFGRLARTLDAMTAISFGPPELARTTLLGLDAVHARVKGTLPGGMPYSAADPELRW